MADIAVHDLSKVYRSKAHPDGLLALDRISLAVADHEFVCLLAQLRGEVELPALGSDEHARVNHRSHADPGRVDCETTASSTASR